MIESLPAIRRAIREATGSTVDAAPEPVGGGCIHRAFRIGPFFVKITRPDCAAMFEAEADGLRAIAATRTIRVPEPIANGCDIQSAFLVLENPFFPPPPDRPPALSTSFTGKAIS